MTLTFITVWLLVFIVLLSAFWFINWCLDEFLIEVEIDEKSEGEKNAPPHHDVNRQ